MNGLARLAVFVYANLLNLYPRRFKEEFAAEMRTVFGNSIADAAQEGTLPLALVFGREILGMPFQILKEIHHEMRGGEVDMHLSNYGPMKKGSWGDATWAGLPHFLLAVLAATTTLVADSRLATLSGIVIGFSLLAGFLATILYTWRDRWPAWTASWYGYVGLIVLLFSILPNMAWVGLAATLYAAIRAVLLVLAVATVLYWLTRRNPIEGLLMATPLMILYWLPVTEFIPNEIRLWLTVWLFLPIALTSATITRLNDIRSAVWFVLGASVLTGLPIAFARTYLHNIPAGHYTAPSLGKMAEIFATPWLASGALVIAPVLGWGLWNLGKRHGRLGRPGAGLTILGLATNLLGHFAYWWTFNENAYFSGIGLNNLFQPTRASATVLVYLGLALLFVGSAWLGALTWGQNKALAAALVVAPLALPLLVMFPTYFGNRIALAGSSLEITRLAEGWRLGLLFLGALWLTMSGWTVTRLYSLPQPEGVV